MRLRGTAAMEAFMRKAESGSHRRLMLASFCPIGRYFQIPHHRGVSLRSVFRAWANPWRWVFVRRVIPEPLSRSHHE